MNPIHFVETNYDRRKRYSNESHKYNDIGVLMGYWFDERARKEIETEGYLKALEENELPFQKLDRYVNSLSRPMQLTTNLDGFLHHGDVIRLKWLNPDSKEILYLAASPFNVSKDGTFDEPCLATATADKRVLSRTAFYIFRNNNYVPNRIPVSFGEIVIVCSSEETGHRLLNCEPISFTKCATKSKHMEVTFVKELSGRGLWRVLCADKNRRLREEGHYIPCNTNVVFQHVATGQNLALEIDENVSTLMGVEKEVSGHSYMDRHKNDQTENLWQIEAPLRNPDEDGKPMEFPTS